MTASEHKATRHPAIPIRQPSQDFLSAAFPCSSIAVLVLHTKNYFFG